MIAKEVFDAIGPVVEVLDELAVPYVIGGSVASSTYGINRATADIDMAVDLKREHVRFLVAKLENDYYIDEQMLLDTIRNGSSCNIIYLASMTKIDFFMPKTNEFDLQQFSRANKVEFEIDGKKLMIAFAAPEDVVLRKLLWYQVSGSTSERQWNDVLGVLKVQAQTIDMEYLQIWGYNLGISDLLERALEDAGLSPTGEIEI